MATEKAVVLYDGQCPLCQRSVAWLRRLDWLKKLEFRDARMTANLPACAVPLDPKRLLDEMHVVPPGGATAYAGFRAFRYIAGRLPLLWVTVPFWYVPGVPTIGQRVYLWVAKSRYQLVPCNHGECQVPLRK